MLAIVKGDTFLGIKEEFLSFGQREILCGKNNIGLISTNKDVTRTEEVGMGGRSSDIIEHRYLSILPLLLEPRRAVTKFKKEEKD